MSRTPSRKPAKPKAAAPQARAGLADGNVRAVDRAIALLGAFRDEDGPLGLAELSRRVGLNMTTALRLLQTLEAQGFVQRLPSGGYLLGATLLLLGERFRRSLRLDNHVIPALERLRAETDESAVFFVRDGDQRRCLYRLDSPQLVRAYAPVGEVFPLGHGAHGRALIALEDGAGPPALPVVTRAERHPDLAAIAAPVLDAAGGVAGSIGVSVPLYRFTPEMEALCRRLTMREALQVTRELGGDPRRLGTDMAAD
ncbi:helix-turn-helix domain-containing protein [Roseococcus sp. SDR]|uniref:IclR family transcriptional regulator n=1 Tax=Roseococcus sp. SDR TaxID=2835532 RepID=UPI001BCE7E66|nr:helix-turn-helix domain-containing protein [Roseococcus sp. SDR]MBV1846974.1 helix-turn-helix domain-containing protein [Roseococcus sp. SDR]